MSKIPPKLGGLVFDMQKARFDFGGLSYKRHVGDSPFKEFTLPEVKARSKLVKYLVLQLKHHLGLLFRGFVIVT